MLVDLYALIWIGMTLAIYGVPLAVGFYVSTRPVAIILAVASWCGLLVSVWSALGPLSLPLVGALITPYELFAVLILCLLVGALQAAIMASLGFALKHRLASFKRRMAPL